MTKNGLKEKKEKYSLVQNRKIGLILYNVYCGVLECNLNKLDKFIFLCAVPDLLSIFILLKTKLG